VSRTATLFRALAAIWAGSPPAFSHRDKAACRRSYARGACSAAEARAWCTETLEPVFADGNVTVIIPGYIVMLTIAD
jgi:hypothetical protein